ncbi:MAG: hypothetical protein WB699_12465, partial [Bacteroidota bacterium]
MALRPEWESLWAEAGGTLYQSFFWLSTWWQVYHDKVQMQLLVVRDGGRLVGLVPCFIEVMKFGLFRLRR